MPNFPMTPNPYLHTNKHSIHNPFSDEVIDSSQFEYPILRQILENSKPIESYDTKVVKNLMERQFLIRSNEDLSEQYFLKYVSLETHSVCNQGCYFCPVSIAEKDKIFMPDELFDSILKNLDAHKETLEGVFLNGYNEPTLDKRLFNHLKKFKELNIKVAINSNATGLTPELADKMANLDIVHYLSINLSTLDSEKYKQDRRADHLRMVLRNIDYLSKNPFFPQMKLAVLGSGDSVHQSEYEKICNRYMNTSFETVKYSVNDRTGNIPLTGKSTIFHSQLKGCDQTGSRVIQHLHVNASGECIICCQDYFENQIIGDLKIETIDSVMSGEKFQQLRKWTYGIEDAPEKFICRNCEFAIT